MHHLVPFKLKLLMNNNGSSPRWWRYACAGLKLEWKPFHIFHRWNICVNHLYLLRVTQFSNIRQNEATNNDFHLKHKWQMQMLCNISEEFEGPHGHDTLEKCFLHVNYALKHFLVNTPWRCSWKLTLGIRPCFWRKCYQMQMLCKSFLMSEEFEGPHGHDTDYPILLLLLVFFYLSFIFRKCTFGHTRHESGKTNNYKYDICHIESCLHFICSFWHCAFSCGSSAALTLCRSSCIACRQKVSRRCVKACDTSDHWGDWKRSCTAYIQMAVLQCGWACGSWER